MITDPKDGMQVGAIASTEELEPNAESLIVKVQRCRRLAAGISDRQAADVLRGMATQYEENATRNKA